jgi:hypothetical protein
VCRLNLSGKQEFLHNKLEQHAHVLEVFLLTLCTCLFKLWKFNLFFDYLDGGSRKLLQNNSNKLPINKINTDICCR